MTDALADTFRFHARYNRWFNGRLFATCSTLDDAARRADRGAFFGSIHGTLNHLLWADLVWFGRFATQPGSHAVLHEPWAVLPAGASQRGGVHADWGALCAHRAQADEAIERWCAQLDAAQLEATIRYANMAGTGRAHPLWQALTHVFNHQTHHRGQVTTLLAQAGVDVGTTDMAALF